MSARSNQRRALQLAVAETFIRRGLRRAPLQRTILSREVRAACDAWCAEHSLPTPSAQELAWSMRQMGYAAKKSNGQRLWCGVRLHVADHDNLELLADAHAFRRLLRGDPRIPVATFCQLVGIARSTFYAMQQRGAAPPVHRLRNRVFVSLLDAVRWCQARARHAGVLHLYEWAHTWVWTSAPVRNRAAALCGASDIQTGRL